MLMWSVPVSKIQVFPPCDLHDSGAQHHLSPKEFQEFDTQAQYFHKSAQLNQATEIYKYIIF